jgi:hypothetical protein
MAQDGGKTPEPKARVEMVRETKSDSKQRQEDSNKGRQQENGDKGRSRGDRDKPQWETHR